MQTPTNYFLASLAVADLLISLFLPTFLVSVYMIQGAKTWSLIAIVVKTCVHNICWFYNTGGGINIKTSHHSPGSDPTHTLPDPSTFTEIGNKLNYRSPSSPPKFIMCQNINHWYKFYLRWC